MLITRQVHANFVGLAAAWMARVPPGWKGKLLLVQDQLIELRTQATGETTNGWPKQNYRFADGLLVPSPAMREKIISWCGLDPSSVALVPNPIPKFSGTLASPPHPWLQDGRTARIHAHVRICFRSSGSTCSSTPSLTCARAMTPACSSWVTVRAGPMRMNRSGGSGSARTPRRSGGSMIRCSSRLCVGIGAFFGRGGLRAGADRGDERRLPGHNNRFAGGRPPIRDGQTGSTVCSFPGGTGQAAEAMGDMLSAGHAGHSIRRWARERAGELSPGLPAPLL